MSTEERRAYNVQMAQDIAYMRGVLEGWQKADAAEKDAIKARVTSLESTNTRQWWLHGIQTVLIAAFGIAKRIGVV